MNCDNCGVEIDINEDEVVHVSHPVANNLQTICIPCDRKIPWKTMIDPKLKKPVQFYGDLN